MLAPARESLSLIPQLFIARAVRERPVRKWFWSAGSVGQAAALIAMAGVALTMRGAAAGWTILALVCAFALARGMCSVSHKDVLGKTVSKTRRGAVSGYASSLSGAAALVFGGALIFGFAEGAGPVFFATLLIVAAVLWLIAAGAYTLLKEEPGATEGGGNAAVEAIRQLAILRDDAPFRRFVIARTAFIATSLSPPFYVAVAREQTGAELAGLGGFLIASATASLASGWIWGRFADRSSRGVLIAAGLAATLSAAIAAAGAFLHPPGSDSSAWYVAALFVLALSHEGVRLGRSTYVVDLATAETRAAYTAVSNTVIGVLVLALGAITGVAYALTGPWILVILASSTLIASALSLRLKEVSG
nr:MFS transporter [Marinicauda salina]